MSDRDRISPHNISAISSRQVMIVEKNISWGFISWSKTKSRNWHRKNCLKTERRITEETLGMKGLILILLHIVIKFWFDDQPTEPVSQSISLSFISLAINLYFFLFPIQVKKVKNSRDTSARRFSGNPFQREHDKRKSKQVSSIDA